MLGISTSANALISSMPRLIVSTRFMSLLLSVGVRGCEGHVGAGRFIRASQGRIVGYRHREAPGVVKLRDQANVGNRRRIAEQECPGTRARHFLQCCKAVCDPV